jgi:hypothetical protein
MCLSKDAGVWIGAIGDDLEQNQGYFILISLVEGRRFLWVAST